MSKIIPTKPLLVTLYGFPGAGKTHFSRQLSEHISSAHLNGDRIRAELFENPRYDKHENDIINHLMQYMAEEFLKAGVSVVYDYNTMRASQRRELREVVRRTKAQPMLIWLQIDADSAFARLNSRDRRKADDKYAMAYDKKSFADTIAQMQNPQITENYIVISGKHTFNTQRSAVVRKLYELGLVGADSATSRVIKPGMVNLIPQLNGGRVDLSRRNITIR